MEREIEVGTVLKKNDKEYVVIYWFIAMGGNSKITGILRIYKNSPNVDDAEYKTWINQVAVEFFESKERRNRL